MSTDLIDSNLIIYAAQPEHDELRGYIAEEAPAVSVVSKVETLGYHGLGTGEKAFLEDFFGAAVVLPVSQSVVEEAIRLRQKQNMSLGDALIAGTAISHGLRVVTHNTGDHAGKAGAGELTVMRSDVASDSGTTEQIYRPQVQTIPAITDGRGTRV